MILLFHSTTGCTQILEARGIFSAQSPVLEWCFYKTCSPSWLDCKLFCGSAPVLLNEFCSLNEFFFFRLCVRSVGRLCKQGQLEGFLVPSVVEVGVWWSNATRGLHNFNLCLQIQADHSFSSRLNYSECNYFTSWRLFTQQHIKKQKKKKTNSQKSQSARQHILFQRPNWR